MPASGVTDRSRRITDQGQLSEFFVSWNGRFEQLSSGRMSGSLHVVQGELLRAVSVETNQTLRVHGQAEAGLRSLYLVGARNADSLWQGRRLRPGQIVFHGADVTVDHRTSRCNSSCGLSVPANELDRAIRCLLGMDVAPTPRIWGVIEPDPRAYSGLVERIRKVLDLAPSNTSVPGSAESRAVEQDCLRWVVRAIVNEVPNSSRNHSLPSRAALVRIAEDFMRSRMSEPFGALDLCAHLGVSDRTLRLAFRERYGIGPMAYYQFIRLNAVRTALRASRKTGTVAQAANSNGFDHLGNFASAYRRLFGERPSETLRNGCA